MRLKYLLLPTVLLNLGFTSGVLANELEDNKTNAISLKLKLQRARGNSAPKLPRLREIKKFSTNANWLTQTPNPKVEPTEQPSAQEKQPPPEEDEESYIEVEGERETFTETSSPVYIVPKEEIEKQKIYG